MTRGSRIRAATATFLAVLWCICFYRAATQSFVHDEAWTWELYLSRPLSVTFHQFSASNHFLNTLLMRVCMDAFGMSELALRLPTLAGAALFFWAVYRLTRRAFASGPTMLLAAAVVALNPLTLDFMVAARGYGLGLALLTWAFSEMLKVLVSRRPPRKTSLALIGMALALSVTATLIFALPAMLLGILFLALKARDIHGSAWVALLIPGASIALLFAALYPFNPFDPAQRADFYYGAHTAVESARNLAASALQHGGPLQSLRIMNGLCDAAAFIAAPMILAAGFWTGLRKRDSVLILASGCCVGCIAILIAAHTVTGLLYPLDRTGIYFAPLVAIALVRIGHLARETSPALFRAACALACAAVLIFFSELDVHRFMVWAYDADTKLLAARIADVRDPFSPSIQIGGDWQFEPALNFYRVKNHWTWMAPVLRRTLDAPADFFALLPDRDPAASGLNVIWTSPVVHSKLAVRPR